MFWTHCHLNDCESIDEVHLTGINLLRKRMELYFSLKQRNSQNKMIGLIENCKKVGFEEVFGSLKQTNWFS